MLKTVSRSMSDVGRVDLPGGATSGIPRAEPPVTRKPNSLRPF
jgi:hypothetical protein